MGHFITSCVCALTLGAAATTFAADVEFREHTITMSADGVRHVTAADIDGDGRPDLLATAQFSNELLWFRNDGVCPPTFTEFVIASSGTIPNTVVPADLDADGDLDVIVAWMGTNEVTWYESDGLCPPSFVEHTMATGLNKVQAAYPGDINGDGFMDIVVSAWYSDKLSWFENDGGAPPAFTEHVVAQFTFNSPRGGRPHDMDGDGDLDIVYALEVSGKIDWMENDGMNPPSFTRWPVGVGVPNPWDIEIADLDGDGHPDVLASAHQSDSVLWFENDGAATPAFFGHTISATADGARSVYAADIDGDGDLDALSASVDDNKVAWYDNDGGTPPMFTERVITTGAMGAFSVIATDLDGDGDLDVVAASRDDDTLRWFESICPGDQDGDGDVDFDDLNAVLANWGRNCP